MECNNKLDLYIDQSNDSNFVTIASTVSASMQVDMTTLQLLTTFLHEIHWTLHTHFIDHIITSIDFIFGADYISVVLI